VELNDVKNPKGNAPVSNEKLKSKIP